MTEQHLSKRQTLELIRTLLSEPKLRNEWSLWNWYVRKWLMPPYTEDGVERFIRDYGHKLRTPPKNRRKQRKTVSPEEARRAIDATLMTLADISKHCGRGASAPSLSLMRMSVELYAEIRALRNERYSI
ncbi:MAG: hypothetical protein ACYTBJ_26315 [Planctomycetota bacterium]|jgi:hypothetical protein